MLFAEPGDTVDITLTHPGSDVRVLRLITPDHGMRLHVRPTSYEYLPSDQDKHPWLHQFTDAWDLPGVNLTRSDGFPRMTEAEWQDRDLLIGFGGMRGTVRMGQLMLDAGRCSDPRDEYELEGEIGFRGVSPGSCELRIWLPGSIAWGSWQPEVPLT